MRGRWLVVPVLVALAVPARGDDAALDGKKLRKAIDDCTRAIEKDPKGSKDARLERARAWLELREYNKAREDLDAIIEKDDRASEAFALRGRVKAALGQWEAAQTDLNEAIDLNPASPDGYLERGRMFLARRRLPEAIKDLEVAITRRAENAAALLELGRALQAALDLDRALAQYDQAIKATDAKDPLRAAALAAKGELLLLRADPLETLVDVGAEKAAEELRAREGAAKQAFDEALAAAARSVPALVGRARLHLRKPDAAAAKKDLDAARVALEKRPWVTEKTGRGGPDPDLAVVEALLGLAALQGASWDEAAKRFEAASKADPESAFAAAGLALAREKKGEGAKARPLFEKARGLGDREERALVQDGRELSRSADRSKKRDTYRAGRWSFAAAIARDPLHAVAHLERGRLAALWSRPDLAALDATRALAADPYLAAAYELRGSVERDRAKAAADFTKAIELSADAAAKAPALLGRARVRLELKDLDGASADLAQALETVPKDVGAWTKDEATPAERVRLAASALELQAKVREAKGDADGALAARTQGAEVRRAASAAAVSVLESARALRDKRNYSDAIARFDRVIDLDPELADAHYDRGTCFLKIGNFVPGILDFSRAVELDPRYSDQYYNKVYQVSYVVDLNRVIAELDKIIEDHPQDTPAIFTRGFFYLAKTELKKFEPADVKAGIRDFTRCIELEPKAATAYVYRGILRLKAGELDAALENAEKTTELDPKNAEASVLRAMVWSLRSAEAGVAEAEQNRRHDLAVKELQTAIEVQGFKGFERVKKDKAFEPIRSDARVQKLLAGK